MHVINSYDIVKAEDVISDGNKKSLPLPKPPPPSHIKHTAFVIIPVFVLLFYSHVQFHLLAKIPPITQSAGRVKASTCFEMALMQHHWTIQHATSAGSSVGQ